MNYSELAKRIVDRNHGRVITHSGIQAILEVEMKNYVNEWKKEALQKIIDQLTKIQESL